MTSDEKAEVSAPSAGVSLFCRRLAAMELAGATACARELCNVLLDTYSGVEFSDSLVKQLVADIAYVTRQVDVTKPATSLYRLVLGLIHDAAWPGETDSTPPGSRREIGRSVVQVARAISSCLEQSSRSVGEHCVELLEGDESIVIYDYSSTVMEAVELVATVRGPFRRIVVPECRITGLGTRVAITAAQYATSVEIVADCAIRSALVGIDAILLGAEVILSTGELINTMGSRPLAELGAAAGIASYALSSALKVEEASSDEIFDEMFARKRPTWYPRDLVPPPPNVEVRCDLLEVTPVGLLTGYVVETGLVGPSSVFSAYQAVSRHFREDVERASVANDRKA
jgi:translation initiation factor 2B subunit (eIF-2B alpha/beta/delta family)